MFSEEQWNDLSDYKASIGFNVTNAILKTSYMENLEHHGVDKQKWGVRRGPPYPLSENQKKYGKAGVAMDEKKKLALEKDKEQKEIRAKKREEAAKAKAEKKAAEAKAKAEREEEQEKEKAEKKAKKAEIQRQKILRDPSKLYKHRNEFTYAEIQTAMSRFEWESKLSDYSAKKMKRGSDFINSLVNYSSSAINLYNNAARIVNSMTDDKKSQLKVIKPLTEFYISNNKDKDNAKKTTKPQN